MKAKTITNDSIFKKLSSFNGVKLEINLDSTFEESYAGFRSATSYFRKWNGANYRAVYLPKSAYGGLTINYGEGKKLQLIVNLEYYYVYGFLIEGKAFGFKHQGYNGLKTLGFDATELSYQDGYSDIRDQSEKEGLPDITTKRVHLSTLYASLDDLIDLSISFDLKSNDILVCFWSLIEGIRFAWISNIIEDQLNNRAITAKYDDFYYLATQWKTKSVAAAKKGEHNPLLAVYELDSLFSHAGELKK